MKRWNAVAAGALSLGLACGGTTEGDTQAAVVVGEATHLSADCTGLMPTSTNNHFIHVDGVNPLGGSCLAGTSDGAGTLVAQKNDCDGNACSHATLLNAAGAVRGSLDYVADLGGGLQPQSSGFVALSTHEASPGPPYHHVEVDAWTSSGVLIGKKVLVDISAPDAAGLPDRIWAAARDPAGGIFVAHVSVANGAWSLYAQGFDAHAATRGNLVTLASGPAAGVPHWMAVAMNGARHALVVWDVGTAAHAQWTDATGKPLSASFTLPLTSSATLVALLDQSIAVQTASGWPFRIPSASRSTATVPSWLSTRPQAQVDVVRGGRAYLLSFPASAPGCDAALQFAVFAPAGNRCGGFSLPVPPGTCLFGTPAGVGLDGSVSVTGYEYHDSTTSFGATCNTEFWPALLK